MPLRELLCRPKLAQTLNRGHWGREQPPQGTKIVFLAGVNPLFTPAGGGRRPLFWRSGPYSGAPKVQRSV